MKRRIRPPCTTVDNVDDIPTAADEQVAAAIADPEADTVHPIINGRVMLPGATFVARNRISGKCHTFKYRGRMGHSLSGEATVEATDVKGNGRSVSVESIVTVRPQRRAS